MLVMLLMITTALVTEKRNETGLKTGKDEKAMQKYQVTREGS